MKFKSIVNYSKTSRNNVLYTERCLTNMFNDYKFNMINKENEIPIFAVCNNDRIFVGYCTATLEYPEVIIEGTLNENEFTDDIRKLLCSDDVSCVLGGKFKKFYDAEQDCSIADSCICKMALLSHDFGIPCKMTITTEDNNP